MPDSTVNRTQSTNNRFDAIFTNKKDNSQLTQSDFLNLMIVQMQNQDFTNPMDNSQMITQMVQFSNMQQMQEMASYSKTNYAMSLVGKTVTASRFNVSGNLDTVTGVVQKVSLVDDEYVIYVGGKKYELSQIMEVQNGGSNGGSTVQPDGYDISFSDVKSDSFKVSWEVPTEDPGQAGELKYTVYYSKEPIGTIEDIDQHGKVYGTPDQKGFTKEEITGLDANTVYYVNVVVKDAAGNRTCYKPITVKTTK